MSFAEWKKSGSTEKYEVWKASQSASQSPNGAKGKPSYIPGESMTQYNQRVAQWLKKQAAEHGTNAAYLSKNKRADTGTTSTARVGEIDAGEYANEAAQSTSDAGIAYGGSQAQSGTFENQPITYDVSCCCAVLQ